MPVINMPVEQLLRIVNRDGRVLREEQLPDTLHDVGVELDELTSTRLFACGVCENVLERTDAQGAPLACGKCGADYRAQPHSLTPLGENKVARLDMLAVRPDLFDPGGMGRYIRGFLGARTGLIHYDVAPPRLTVKVDPRLKEEASYRPFIACAVLRNVALDNDSIRLLMALQEDLHWALGRDRKLASIGVYDLATLCGEVFHYDAVLPDELRFTPLGFSPDDPAQKLTPAEILERHKTGQEYARLLKGLQRYPLLRDAIGTVLSMPPIINSESTRVTRRTSACFVDVTGLSQRTVDRALNVLITSLKEILPALEIEAVQINGPDAARITPDLRPAPMALSLRQAVETLGAELKVDELITLLQRMGHGVETAGGEGPTLRVLTPAWRNDVMHPIDLIEDAAVAYGYDRLAPQLVPTFTVGAPRPIEEQSAIARRILTGLGYHQVMTLTLTCAEAAFERWGAAVDPRAVRIENPISAEQTLCRLSLLPGLLETLALNKQYELPQHLFEVGDCCVVDAACETGAREERQVAAALIGTHVGYADIRAAFDAFAFEMMSQPKIQSTERPGFIAGRVAALLSSGGEPIGVMGEVHPQVLEAYGLKHAVVVMEFSLDRLLATA